MQPPHAPSIGFAAALLLFAILTLQPGCVQYKASIEQRFAENGTAFLTVHERMSIDQTLTSEYAATLQNSSDSKLGNRLVGGILAYYNSGAYAKDLCQRSKGTTCQFMENGEVVWNTTMQPDGKFYTQSSQTDWFNMQRVSRYEIGRVPLLHYQAYHNNTPDEAAELEWQGLRHFLGVYLQEAVGNDTNAQQEADQTLGNNGSLRKAINRYAPLKVSEQILNLETGEIRAMSFNSQNASSGIPNPYTITLSYLVEFPNPITTARLGDTPLKAENGQNLRLTLDNTQIPPKGRLVVMTKKSLSPLGIYTWVIPIIGIVFTLLRQFFLGSKKIWKEDE